MLKVVITVSSDSELESSTGVISTVAEAFPAKIVTKPLKAEKSAPLLAVPLTA